MSRDLNIERSSTRLHAPPGGKSSFSIGGDYEPVKAVPVKVVAPVPAVASAPVVAPAQSPYKAQQSTMGSIIGQEAPTQRNSVRVRQAPGGASSIVIG